MKILIFENEFNEMEPLFEVLKSDYEDFEYEYFSNSQTFKSFDKINDYDNILVDLKLSDRTKMEGYDILEKIKKLGYDMTKVAIITGHTIINAKLKEKGLSNIEIIEKPFYIDEIEKFLGLE